MNDRATERTLLVTDNEMWAIHHARLAVKGPVLDIMEKWLTRNGWFFEKLNAAPPKAPAGFQTVHYFECLQCGEEVLPEHTHICTSTTRPAMQGWRGPDDPSQADGPQGPQHLSDLRVCQDRAAKQDARRQHPHELQVLRLRVRGSDGGEVMIATKNGLRTRKSEECFRYHHDRCKDGENGCECDCHKKAKGAP